MMKLVQTVTLFGAFPLALAQWNAATPAAACQAFPTGTRCSFYNAGPLDTGFCYNGLCIVPVSSWAGPAAGPPISPAEACNGVNEGASCTFNSQGPADQGLCRSGSCVTDDDDTPDSDDDSPDNDNAPSDDDDQHPSDSDDQSSPDNSQDAPPVDGSNGDQGEPSDDNQPSNQDSDESSLGQSKRMRRAHLQRRLQKAH